MLRFCCQKLLYGFLILSFIINPFIYMGNLSRHDNLPAYPVLIFKTNSAHLHELQKTFALLRLDSHIILIEQSSAKYETTLPDFSAHFLHGFNDVLHASFSFKLSPNMPLLGVLTQFSLTIKQIDLPFPDKPPILAL
jgi:hypothetical protein